MATEQPLIVFGDGSQALFYDEKTPIQSRERVLVQPILLVPEEKVILTYGLTDLDLNILTDDKRDATWREYPVRWVDWLNRSGRGAVLFIWCAFDGKKTPIMNKLNDMLEWDRQRDKTEHALRAQISMLQHKLASATSNQHQLFMEYRKLVEIVNPPSEEEDED